MPENEADNVEFPAFGFVAFSEAEAAQLALLLDAIKRISALLPDPNVERAKAIILTLRDLATSDEGWSVLAMIVLVQTWIDALMPRPLVLSND